MKLSFADFGLPKLDKANDLSIRGRLRQKGDDGGGVHHGPLLCLATGEQLGDLVAGRAELDFSKSWSNSDSIHFTSLTELEVTVGNYGDIDTRAGQLQFVVWGQDLGQVGYFTHPMPIQVPASKTIDENLAEPGETTEPIQINLAALRYAAGASRIERIGDITHLYAVVYELLDGPDEPSKDLILAARSGTKFLDYNPCRRSRKIGCAWPPPAPFDVKGNTISHSRRGYIEIALVDRKAQGNASFGLVSSSGSGDEIWLTDLLHSPFGTYRDRHFDLPEGDVVFVLNGAAGRLLSDLTNPRRAIITMRDGGKAVDLNWEDAKDFRYGDYILRLLHR